MPPVLLDAKPVEHVCPNCDVRKLAIIRAPQHAGEVTQPFHVCAGLGGLDAPLLPVGVKAKVEAVEREDDERGQLVWHDDSGRAIMSIVTTRDDGQDCAVLAPTALVDMKGRTA